MKSDLSRWRRRRSRNTAVLLDEGLSLRALNGQRRRAAELNRKRSKGSKAAVLLDEILPLLGNLEGDWQTVQLRVDF